MKSLLFLILLVAFANAAKPLCVSATENDMVVLECPPGNFIAAINFASYGLPNSCTSAGSCHVDIKAGVETLCLNRPSCQFRAENNLWGDPCYSITKRVGVAALCMGPMDIDPCMRFPCFPGEKCTADPTSIFGRICT